ncbi:hypothetical protein RvY_00248-3 [Ramazzottius varieornatus]|uniref:G-protein coupled receptors family 1 profile domain-containing protein n=1 Tax=Ramazzottius varieornatus TaxID=947166 RepID=A0A1D1UD29_RAMVA|nr:hypothetical protein RvY_00248-3 [Ramazzottius varieornatus]
MRNRNFLCAPFLMWTILLIACCSQECIVACWAFGLIAGILPLFAQLDVDGVQVFYGQNGVCLPLFIHEPFFKGWWMSTLIFIVVPSTAMLVVVCCYVSVFRHIEESRQATDRVSADKPHLKRVLTITISNLLCWVPIIILKAMAMAMFAIPGQVYSWMAVFILPLNCCINPIMYTLMTPECISAMKNCKWCNHTRNSSINSNSCCNTAFSVSTNGRVRSCASLTLRKIWPHKVNDPLFQIYNKRRFVLQATLSRLPHRSQRPQPVECTVLESLTRDCAVRAPSTLSAPTAVHALQEQHPTGSHQSLLRLRAATRSLLRIMRASLWSTVPTGTQFRSPLFRKALLLT